MMHFHNSSTGGALACSVRAMWRLRHTQPRKILHVRRQARSNASWDRLLAGLHRDYLLGVLTENEIFAGGGMRQLLQTTGCGFKIGHSLKPNRPTRAILLENVKSR